MAAELDAIQKTGLRTYNDLVKGQAVGRIVDCLDRLRTFAERVDAPQDALDGAGAALMEAKLSCWECVSQMFKLCEQVS